MEGTYSTSCYLNSIMLKKYLVKTGSVQKNQQNYLGTKKNFHFPQLIMELLQDNRLIYFTSPLRPSFRVRKNSLMTFTVYIFVPTVIFFSYLIVLFIRFHQKIVKDQLKTFQNQKKIFFFSYGILVLTNLAYLVGESPWKPFGPPPILPLGG